MTTIEAIELNDAELEVIAGGMDCKTGLKVADFYGKMSDCMLQVGNFGLAYYYNGLATGTLQGACA